MPEADSQPTSTTPKKPPKKLIRRLIRKIGLSGLLVIILVIAIAAAVVFYKKYQDTQNKLKHPEIVAQATTKSLVEKVGRHIELPKDEQPTVATVSDVSKLSGQTFFTNAKNGDKVLIYTKSNTAILYRPTEDKIINVGSINTGTTAQ